MKYRLEMNTSGSWKLVMKFDPFDGALRTQIEEATDALAKLAIASEGRSVMAWRMSTDTPQPRPVAYWRREGGMWLPA